MACHLLGRHHITIQTNADLLSIRPSDNKANLRDLIAATCLVILLKLDSIFYFSAHMTLKLFGWIKKTIGHLLYATSSFVHYFTAISEFKLGLQSGNTHFEWKSTIFLSRVTMKFDRWPWKTIGNLFYAISSFVHHFVGISQFKLKLQSGNSQFRSKAALFLSLVTLKFDRWAHLTKRSAFYLD